ncbi:hypothetical protein P4C99_21635 [Pontiellaceae bacterium B1224]|nr:hypothetical protein [Pontiellaceae bacterium B1224]
MDIPIWALRPTLFGFVIASLFWFRSSIFAYMDHGQTGRAIVFGLADAVAKYIVATLTIWGLICLSGAIAENLFIRIPLLFIIGVIFYTPLIILGGFLYGIFVSIIRIPLKIIFPIKYRASE